MISAELLRARARAYQGLVNTPLYKFVPRPDKPELYDEQTSWVNSKANMAVCVAGNRSGKTYSAAIKTARIITMYEAPPFPESIFIVLSDTFTQVANICWKDKLSQMIPHQLIDWERCTWHSRKAGQPTEIVMKPWPNGNRWVLEFRSCDQSRRHFQGRAYCGLWVSEQAPFQIVEEIRRGFVDHPIPGTCFMEFTPLDPDITVDLEERMDRHAEGKLPGWEFFHLNAELNTYINQEQMRAYLSEVSPEIRETRRIGKLASFAGAVYPNWNMQVHVVSDSRWADITGMPPPPRYESLSSFKRLTPNDIFFRRGVDFGESLEHAFACVWGWKNANGDWFIFDEYIDNLDPMYDRRFDEVIDRYPWPDNDPHFGMTYCDGSRPGLVAEMGKRGINCQNANKSVEDGFETIRRLLPLRPGFLANGRKDQLPRLILLKSRCQTLSRQMWKLRYLRSQKPGVPDTRVNKKKAANQPQDWDNDAADALRYLIHSDTPYEGKGPSFLSTIEETSRYGLHLNKGTNWRR